MTEGRVRNRKVGSSRLSVLSTPYYLPIRRLSSIICHVIYISAPTRTYQIIRSGTNHLRPARARSGLNHSGCQGHGQGYCYVGISYTLPLFLSCFLPSPSLSPFSPSPHTPLTSRPMAHDRCYSSSVYYYALLLRSVYYDYHYHSHFPSYSPYP